MAEQLLTWGRALDAGELLAVLARELLVLSAWELQVLQAMAVLALVVLI